MWALVLSVFVSLLMLIQVSPASSQPFRIGPEFQVNAHTTGSPGFPSIAVDSSGSFAVVWHSPFGLGPSSSIYGQRFDGAGNALGTEFLVNTYTTGDQDFASIASDGSGGFIVVWSSMGSSGTDPDYSIQGQRFDSDGIPFGTEFQVNTYTTGAQGDAQIAADASGGFVVTWSSMGSGGTDSPLSYSVQAQRFDNVGTPVGTQFQVNTHTTNEQVASAVAVGPSGDFVVVWEVLNRSFYAPFPVMAIKGQRFDSAGAAVGTEFQVNSSTPYEGGRPSVALADSGNFLVAWGGIDPSHGIRGQLFDSMGTLVGTELLVNTYTSGTQARASAAVDESGGFIVVWESGPAAGPDEDGASVRGQRFDGDGVPLGTEFQANTNTHRSQWLPAVGGDGSGGVVVAWRSQHRSGNFGPDLVSIQGQRYAMPTACGLSPAPDASCTLASPSGAGKSSLDIKHRAASTGTKDKLKWKWKRGPTVAVEDFRMPDASTHRFRVCLYDAGGKLAEMNLQPGGSSAVCDGKPCWKATSKGFRYKSRSGAGSDGMTSAKFAAGLEGKSSIQITATGRGGYYKAPQTAVLTEPVVVQLLIDDGVATECFKTTFSSFKKKDAENYKAKGP